VAVLKVWLLFSQSEQLKSIQKAMIGWKKAGSPKSHFYFDHVNRLLVSVWSDLAKK